MKNQTLEPLASAKWSLLFLLVPVASDDMDINGKIEILQKGESCGSLGLFCFFWYVRWLALWMAFVYVNVCCPSCWGFTDISCLFLSLHPAYSELPLVPYSPFLLTCRKPQI